MRKIFSLDEIKTEKKKTVKELIYLFQSFKTIEN